MRHPTDIIVPQAAVLTELSLALTPAAEQHSHGLHWLPSSELSTPANGQHARLEYRKCIQHTILIYLKLCYVCLIVICVPDDVYVKILLSSVLQDHSAGRNGSKHDALVQGICSLMFCFAYRLCTCQSETFQLMPVDHLYPTLPAGTAECISSEEATAGWWHVDNNLQD